MKILRKPVTAAKIGATVRTTERWSSDPRYAYLGFPPLIPTGPNISGHVESHVEEWLDARALIRIDPATAVAELSAPESARFPTLPPKCRAALLAQAIEARNAATPPAAA